MITTPPREILIVGAGVFGLSTALTLLSRPSYSTSHITILDSAETLPNPHGSSVDSSRIIRADYAHKSYAKLASRAQERWRDTSDAAWGGGDRYHETGFVLTGNPGMKHYVESSMRNVLDLAAQGLPIDASKVKALPDKDAIRHATHHPGVSGETGYANWNSGWADADKCIAHALELLKQPQNMSRVTLRTNTCVSRLKYDPETHQCTGVTLSSSETLHADLTILATGAWTPTLIPLHNRALATGQVLGYLRLTPEEQTYLAHTPVTMNMSTGLFLIPPRDQELKIARHGFGYRSFTHDNPSTSVPNTSSTIPAEAEHALREALAAFFPATLPLDFRGPPSLATLAQRPFTKTRICWYTDTPKGNFLINYPPLPLPLPQSHTSTKEAEKPATTNQNPNQSLFLATGGSGHAFKFLPVLGEYIAAGIEGTLEDEYRDLWSWADESRLPANFEACEDGSRGGRRNMILEDELRRSTVGSGNEYTDLPEGGK